jgi:hypothetical protein
MNTARNDELLTAAQIEQIPRNNLLIANSRFGGMWRKEERGSRLNVFLVDGFL